MFGAVIFLIMFTVSMLAGGYRGYIKSLGKCKSKWGTALYVFGGVINLAAEFGKSLAGVAILALGLHVSWSILF